MSNLRTIFMGGDPPPPFFAGTDLPNYNAISLDDFQVKEIVFRLGLGHLFATPPPEREQRKGYGGCTTQVYKGHPKHWLMFNHYYGFPSDKDNGYTLRTWLKSDHTEKQFQDFVLQDMKNGQCDFESLIICHPPEKPDHQS